MNFRTIIISLLILTSLTALGQTVDSTTLDLKSLTDIDFFKKYSFYDNSISKHDIKLTKLIWSLGQLREIDKSLRQKGVRTFTRIDEKPTNENRYYIIGHYQQPTVDHLTRMAFYRVDTVRKTIDYQNLDDFVKGKWKRIK